MYLLSGPVLGGQAKEIRALIDFGSKVIALTSVFVVNWGFLTWSTAIGMQKIDRSTLRTYNMFITGFLIQDNSSNIWFDEDIFMLADISMKVVLEIYFLVPSNLGI